VPAEVLKARGDGLRRIRRPIGEAFGCVVVLVLRRRRILRGRLLQRLRPGRQAGRDEKRERNDEDE